MKSEYTAEDFAKGVRNPYFHRLCKEVNVAVLNDDYAMFEKIAAENDASVSEVLQRCVMNYARILREDED